VYYVCVLNLYIFGSQLLVHKLKEMKKLRNVSNDHKIIKNDMSLYNWNCLLIDCLQLGLDPPPLRGADRNLVLSPGQRGDRQFGNIEIVTRCRLPSGNRPTLPFKRALSFSD